MDELPLPESGILRKGVIYRVPAPPRGPKRELPTDVQEIIRRGRQKTIREYLERKRAS